MRKVVPSADVKSFGPVRLDRGDVEALYLQFVARSEEVQLQIGSYHLDEIEELDKISADIHSVLVLKGTTVGGAAVSLTCESKECEFRSSSWSDPDVLGLAHKVEELLGERELPSILVWIHHEAFGFGIIMLWFVMMIIVNEALSAIVGKDTLSQLAVLVGAMVFSALVCRVLMHAWKYSSLRGATTIHLEHVRMGFLHRHGEGVLMLIIGAAITLGIQQIELPGKSLDVDDSQGETIDGEEAVADPVEAEDGTEPE